MAPAPALGLPEWTALALIDESPTHGFAIAALTDRDGDLGRIWQMPRPVVYRALGRLADDRLIAPEHVEPGLGPRRTVYAATPKGREAVACWLHSPVEHVREIRSHLLLKLRLLDRRGADVTELVTRQRAMLAPIVAALSAEQAADCSGFEAVLLAWRRATTLAAVAFLDDVAGNGLLWPAS